MGFNTKEFEKLLLPYLNDVEKGRLINSLAQFKTSNQWSEKQYNHFFLNKKLDWLAQGDLIDGIRFPVFNGSEFEKNYGTALLLSNTCDADVSNERKNAKNLIFAPAIPLQIYLQNLANSYNTDSIKTLEKDIKNQIFSNLFYLPALGGNFTDYVVFLDELFWFPAHEIKEILPAVLENRLSSLDYFGYYLLLIKTSYHFCRFNESRDR